MGTAVTVESVSAVSAVELTVRVSLSSSIPGPEATYTQHFRWPGATLDLDEVHLGLDLLAAHRGAAH